VLIWKTQRNVRHRAIYLRCEPLGTQIRFRHQNVTVLHHLPFDTTVPLGTAVQALELLLHSVFSRTEFFCELQPRGVTVKCVHHAEVFISTYTRDTEQVSHCYCKHCTKHPHYLRFGNSVFEDILAHVTIFRLVTVY
jgi:hypothetical protein